MRGVKGKGGAGRDDGASALTGHLREGPQGLAAGDAVSTKRVLRFCDSCWLFRCLCVFFVFVNDGI